MREYTPTGGDERHSDFSRRSKRLQPWHPTTPELAFNLLAVKTINEINSITGEQIKAQDLFVIEAEKKDLFKRIDEAVDKFNEESEKIRNPEANFFDN